MPPAYEDITLLGIKEESVLRITRSYLSGFYEFADAGLAPFFTGRAGGYKTYAALVIAKTVHKLTDINVDFFACSQELPKMDRGWFDGSAQKRIDQLATTPLVIIDDMAEARPTGRERQILTELIHARYNQKLPTIFTANIVIKDRDLTPIDDIIGLTARRRLIERSEGLRVMIK